MTDLPTSCHPYEGRILLIKILNLIGFNLIAQHVSLYLIEGKKYSPVTTCKYNFIIDKKSANSNSFLGCPDRHSFRLALNPVQIIKT
jgi:hypothetical protein